MENKLQTIINDTLNVSIRSIIIDHEPWFVAKDICDALGHTNSRMALDKLDDDEKGVSSIYTPGGSQKINIVNEPGLYRLIFSSRKPEAKEFQRWVYHDVLPSLRKFGRYVMYKKRRLPEPGEKVVNIKPFGFNDPSIEDLYNIHEFAEAISDLFDLDIDVATICALDIKNHTFQCLDPIRNAVIDRLYTEN